VVAVEQPQVLGGDPGRGHVAVGVAEVEPAQQPDPGQVGVVVVVAAQDPADAVERVAGPAGVPEGLLLDPRRTWSTASKPSFTTWKASRTRTASASWVRNALAYPRNGSSAATATPARQPASRTRSQLDRTAPLRPGTTSSSRAGPSVRVRSTSPVANSVAWVEVAARKAVSSTPSAATPSSRAGSSTSGAPCSTTARITVPQPTPKSPATTAIASAS
jgi:hypothetical protein